MSFGMKFYPDFKGMDKTAEINVVQVFHIQRILDVPFWRDLAQVNYL